MQCKFLLHWINWCVFRYVSCPKKPRTDPDSENAKALVEHSSDATNDVPANLSSQNLPMDNSASQIKSTSVQRSPATNAVPTHLQMEHSPSRMVRVTPPTSLRRTPATNLSTQRVSLQRTLPKTPTRLALDSIENTLQRIPSDRSTFALTSKSSKKACLSNASNVLKIC